MTLHYLLDTNICIFIIKHKPAAVRARFQTLPPSSVGISSVTEAELLHGVYKSQRVDENLENVLGFVSRIEVVPFDSHVTPTYGQIRAKLEKAGKPIGPLDFQIAATALTLGLVLVTNNIGEFSRVSGLRVEDWTA